MIDWFLISPGQYEFAGHTEHTGVRARRFLRLELCPSTNVVVRARRFLRLELCPSTNVLVSP